MTIESSRTIEPPEGTWVIIPVHNRRDVTAECLAELKGQQAWGRLNVVVVDDGSEDGTSALVREQYPSVHILEGDGSLWWGGAIKKGMEFAFERGADVFIWLNDDVIPRPGVLGKLASKASEVGDTVLGGMVYPTTGHEYTTRWNRSRFGMKSVRYEPELEIQPCEMLAGKLVAIPRAVPDEIGFPGSQEFDHAFADFEYTCRATECGFDVGVCSEAVAMDTAYTFENSGLSADCTFSSAIRGVVNPSSDQSIMMKYRRDKRFGSAPAPLILGNNVLKGLGVVAIKFALCVFNRNHRFT